MNILTPEDHNLPSGSLQYEQYDLSNTISNKAGKIGKTCSFYYIIVYIFLYSFYTLIAQMFGFVKTKMLKWNILTFLLFYSFASMIFIFVIWKG